MAKRKSKETAEEAAKAIESPNVIALDLSARIDKLEQRFESLKTALIKTRPIKDI